MQAMLTRRATLAALISAPLFAAGSAAADRWPSVVIKPEWIRELNARFAGRSGIFNDDTYRLFLKDYAADGDYLGWSQRVFQNDAELAIMPDGLPMVRDTAAGPLYWNAVTLCHFALARHGAADRVAFLAAAAKLRDLQAADGGFPYPRRPYRDYTLPDGWISAMAQGQALSVFSRAALMSGDQSYCEHGSRALAKLLTPIDQGGCATSLKDFAAPLSNYVFFPEYPTRPIDYTLNGYMFCLLGLYDWSQLAPGSEAQTAFRQGIRTLRQILPYHDIDGFSTYDLSHYVLGLLPYVSAPYLGVHVYLLHALGCITADARLAYYEGRWTAKLEAMNKRLRLVRIDLDHASPQTAGTPISITLATRGGSGSAVHYKFAIKHDGDWTDAQGFSENATFRWEPTTPGDYVLGFFARNIDSDLDFDNFRYVPFEIAPDPRKT
jgi:heparosan-N-sulfate-glucuronate 5-epimerase